LEDQEDGGKEDEKVVGIPKACLALLLLLDGHGDAAHEILLGVTMKNLEEAEIAATHPPSTWSQRHPLNDLDEIVHSIVHRWEGQHIGEGNHTGWENAMYWAAGEPPKLPRHQHRKNNPAVLVPSSLGHPVRQALAAFAVRRAPRLVRLGVVVAPSSSSSSDSPSSCHHEILAGGGECRTVSVPGGWWDPFQFVKLKQRYHQLRCEGSSAPDTDACWREIQEVERHEIALVIKYSMLRQAGLSPDDVIDRLC
jgi:hypothetical protein